MVTCKLNLHGHLQVLEQILIHSVTVPHIVEKCVTTKESTVPHALCRMTRSRVT